MLFLSLEAQSKGDMKYTLKVNQLQSGLGAERWGQTGNAWSQVETESNTPSVKTKEEAIPVLLVVGAEIFANWLLASYACWTSVSAPPMQQHLLSVPAHSMRDSQPAAHCINVISWELRNWLCLWLSRHILRKMALPATVHVDESGSECVSSPSAWELHSTTGSPLKYILFVF